MRLLDSRADEQERGITMKVRRRRDWPLDSVMNGLPIPIREWVGREMCSGGWDEPAKLRLCLFDRET